MEDSRKNYRDSRADFERHLNILAELINSGKMRIAKGLNNAGKGIEKVRFSPNKRIDLNTVDESVRAMAMMAAQHPNLNNENE